VLENLSNLDQLSAGIMLVIGINALAARDLLRQWLFVKNELTFSEYSSKVGINQSSKPSKEV
jgi:hypothetical protein